MNELYSFTDQYIKEKFDVERVLKSSPRGTITRIRHKESHQRYICRRYNEPVQIYTELLGLNCPYLPKVYEAACEDAAEALPAQAKAERSRMIVLEEFIPGDTLSVLLEGGPLSPAEVRRISMQICRGLYVLHSMEWVHRDIKPDNVLIYGDRAVLTDCDAARKHSPEKERDTKILGTVGYAPPEQYGISGTDERADIYAMGVLINEMLTGQHPSQTLAKGRWGRIVSRCTMIHPDKRYMTVKELMEVL